MLQAIVRKQEEALNHNEKHIKWEMKSQINDLQMSLNQDGAMAKAKGDGTGIPEYEIEAPARCLLPEIHKFFESEEGQREFKEWKEK